MGGTVDTPNNRITCTTTAFSTFGVFGFPAPTGGGGSFTQRFAVDVCDEARQQCVRRFPTRAGLEDEAYTNYETCLRGGGGSGFTCSQAWAQAKGFKSCMNDNECRTSNSLSALDRLSNVLRANPTSDPLAVSEELLGSAPELSNESLSEEGSCRKIQYVRSPQYRGRGVDRAKCSDASNDHLP